MKQENKNLKIFTSAFQMPFQKYAAGYDVKKLIHVSAIGANENSKSTYQRSKFQGEVKSA